MKLKPAPEKWLAIAKKQRKGEAKDEEAFFISTKSFIILSRNMTSL